MMRKALLLSVGVVVIGRLFCGSVWAGPSLLANGDAETGDLTAWLVSDPQIGAVASQTQSTGTVFPHEGDYFFSFALAPARDSVNDPPVTIGMYQTGTSGLDAPALRLTGWVQTEGRNDIHDTAEAILSVYDAGDGLLASASTGTLITDNLQWEPFTVELHGLEGLEGAAYWRVDLIGTVYDGTYVNTFFDDVHVAAIPAPGGVILGSLGAGLVGWLRRRHVL